MRSATPPATCSTTCSGEATRRRLTGAGIAARGNREDAAAIFDGLDASRRGEGELGDAGADLGGGRG